MEQLPIQLARLEEKVDAVVDRIDSHHDWVKAETKDQEGRLRALETNRNMLWGALVVLSAAIKMKLFGPLQ